MALHLVAWKCINDGGGADMREMQHHKPQDGVTRHDGWHHGTRQGTSNLPGILAIAEDGKVPRWQHGKLRLRSYTCRACQLL